MRNYYEVLGVSSDATPAQIKQAYRDLAFINHPDRGGDLDQMQRINLAHEVLSNAESRAAYDAALSGDTLEETVAADLRFLTSDADSPSKVYRQAHAKFVAEYRAEPLLIGDPKSLFKPFQSKVEARIVTVAEMPKLPLHLTPDVALGILINYLEGKYSSARVEEIHSYFSDRLLGVELASTPDVLLYRAVLKIIRHASSAPPTLLPSLIAVTSYAKQAIYVSTSLCTRLLSNIHYRDLYSKVLHAHFRTHVDFSLSGELNQFNAKEFIETHLRAAKDELKATPLIGEKNINSVKELRRHVRALSLLAHFDKDLYGATEMADSAENYREKAFHILDWLPAFGGLVPSSVIINFIMQAAICFQSAAQLERDSTQEMADETLALALYQEVDAFLKNSTPNLKLQFLVKSLKLMSHFNYTSVPLQLTIEGYQSRCLNIVNLFPFYEAFQANGVLLELERKSRDDSLRMWCQLLHNLVDVIEANRLADAAHQRKSEHNPVDVLYQAYEACLRGWYFMAGVIMEPGLRLPVREKLRRELIQASLAENNWTVEDVHKNTDAFGILIGRDDDGWLKTTPGLPIPLDPQIDIFLSVDGVEVNLVNGNTRFSFSPLTQWTPPHRRLITVYDLHEMLQNNVDLAVFSLDEAHPDRPLDPFNRMRIIPASIFKSQLQKTMLVTDSILKFFTTGREVNAFFPYSMRSLEALTAGLPYSLKRIIDNYQKAKHGSSKESVHRFWIEAGEVRVVQSNISNRLRFGVGLMPMHIKKHRMTFDARGNLVDASEKDEGWGLYVLSRDQFLEWRRGARVINGPALIFVWPHDSSYFSGEPPAGGSDFIDTVFVVEGSRPPQRFELTNCRGVLINLFRRDRGADGQVLRNTRNTWLNYQTVRRVTKQIKKAHRYTPEYCFAVELSANYELLTNFFPEFARLRELSRVVVLINFLKVLHLKQKGFFKQKADLLANRSYWIGVQEEVECQVVEILRVSKDYYDRNCQVNKERYRSVFLSHVETAKKIRLEFSRDLARIKAEIGVEAAWDRLVTQYHEQFSEFSLEQVDRAMQGNEAMLDVMVRASVARAMQEAFQRRDQVIAELRSQPEKARRRLQAEIAEHDAVIRQLEQLGLRDEEAREPLEGPCVWVPSSLNIEEKERHMVYGGVSITPEVVEINSSDPNYAHAIRLPFEGAEHTWVDTEYMNATREASAAYGPGPRGAANLLHFHQVAQIEHRLHAYQTAYPEAAAAADAASVRAAAARTAASARTATNAARAEASRDEFRSPPTTSRAAGAGASAFRAPSPVSDDEGEGGRGGAAYAGFHRPPSGAGASMPASRAADRSTAYASTATREAPRAGRAAESGSAAKASVPPAYVYSEVPASARAASSGFAPPPPPPAPYAGAGAGAGVRAAVPPPAYAYAEVPASGRTAFSSFSLVPPPPPVYAASVGRAAAAPPVYAASGERTVVAPPVYAASVGRTAAAPPVYAASVGRTAAAPPVYAASSERTVVAPPLFRASSERTVVAPLPYRASGERTAAAPPVYAASGGRTAVAPPAYVTAEVPASESLRFSGFVRMPPPPPRYAAAGASAAVYSAGDRGGFGAAASAAASTSERARDPYSSVFPKVPVDAEAAGSFFAEADSAFASLFSGLKASASGVKKANSSSGVSSSGGFARGAPAAEKARPAAGGSGRPPSPPSEDSEEEGEVSSAARARATRAANEALLASAAAGLPKTFDWDEGIPDFPDILPVSSASVPFPPLPSAVHAGAGSGSRRPPSPKLFGEVKSGARQRIVRGVQMLHHSLVKFSQNSVNNIEVLTRSMEINGWQGDPIDVVRMSDGSLIAVDNTRLLAASRANIPVFAFVHDGGELLSVELTERFMTKQGGIPRTWEEAVINRINAQHALYRNVYPVGSEVTGAK